MRGKRFLAALLFLAVGACASAGTGGPGSAHSGDMATTMTDAMSTYQALGPRLTAAQKEEFREACDRVISAHNTSGVLLASFFDAQDEASARTALLSYRATMAALPDLVNKVARLAKSFKESAR